jgi:hypothetical protein
MFVEEHAPAACEHPELAAFGSHSCAEFVSQAGWQDEPIWLLGRLVMQHTVPEGQFAAPLQASAVEPAPPMSGQAPE